MLMPRIFAGVQIDAGREAGPRAFRLTTSRTRSSPDPCPGGSAHPLRRHSQAPRLSGSSRRMAPSMACVLGGQLGKGLLQYTVAVSTIRDRYDLGTEHLVQQVVGRGARGRLPGQHQDALKTELRGRGRRLAAMIRLERAGADKHLGALILCLRHQEFQLARLVAAECQSGLVVAL